MFRALGAAACRGGSTTSCARVVGRERVCASRRAARSVLLTSTPRAENRIDCWARGPTHPCAAALQRCAVRSTFVKRTPRAHSFTSRIRFSFHCESTCSAVLHARRWSCVCAAARCALCDDREVGAPDIDFACRDEHLQSCFDPSMVSWERLAPVRCAVCGVHI